MSLWSPGKLAEEQSDNAIPDSIRDLLTLAVTLCVDSGLALHGCRVLKRLRTIAFIAGMTALKPALHSSQ
jgi:hypothetical protein